MKTRMAISMIVLFLISLGCTFPTNLNFGGITVSIVSPSPHTLLTAGQAATIYAGAGYTSPAPANVRNFDFYASGQRIGNDPAPSVVNPTYTSGTYDWTPARAGEFQLQAVANLDNSRFVASDPVDVCVLGFTFQAPSYFPSGLAVVPYGYAGPCAVPSAPVTDPTAAVSLSTSASPASLAVENADSTCPSLPDQTLSFQATLTDPGHRVAFVVVDYSAQPSETREGPLALTQGSDGIFRGTTDSMTDFLSLGNTSTPSTSVRWTALAYDHTGAVVAMDGPYDVPTGPCTAPVLVITPHVIQPFPTDTPTLAVTSTLTPTLTSTPTLVPYAGPPTKELTGCRSYADKTTCNNRGCFWQNSTSACYNKTNQCSKYTNSKSCLAAGCGWSIPLKSCF